MFGWFKRKKPEQKAEKKHPEQTYVNQRSARASGDIVGGNKYSTYRPEPTPAYNPFNDPLSLVNPISPLSPLNPIYQTDDEPHKHSHNSGWPSSSSSSDSGSSYSSSSSDSGSSYSSSSSD